MNTITTYVEDKKYIVYLVINHDGDRFKVSTGIKTVEKFDGLIFPPSDPNSQAKTSRLTHLYIEVEEYLLRNPRETGQKIRDAVRSIVSGRVMEAHENLLYYMSKFRETKTNASTQEIYSTTMKRVETFDKEATFDTVNRQWLERYQANELRRGRTVSGIAIDLRNIRTVFNWAIDNEYTAKYPFRKFSIKTERTRHLFLSAEEMRMLTDYEVEPYQTVYRDIFMLGFYLIGINISDLLELPKKSLRRGRIQYRRNKTRRLYDVKVEPEALEIIERYKGEEHLLRFLDEGCHVRTFNRNMNDALKKIGRMKLVKNQRGACVKKRIIPLYPDIVWYTARRSWATIAAEMDIPKETIGKALGHSEWDSTTTDIYIDFNYKKVDEANRKVIDWVLYGERG